MRGNKKSTEIVLMEDRGFKRKNSWFKKRKEKRKVGTRVDV